MFPWFLCRLCIGRLIILWVNLVSSYFAESVYRYRSPLVEFVGTLTYYFYIICKLGYFDFIPWSHSVVLLLLLRLQELYWIGVERIVNLVLFFIVMELLFVPFHLSWCWPWDCCKVPLSCCSDIFCFVDWAVIQEEQQKQQFP